MAPTGIAQGSRVKEKKRNGRTGTISNDIEPTGPSRNRTWTVNWEDGSIGTASSQQVKLVHGEVAGTEHHGRGVDGSSRRSRARINQRHTDESDDDGDYLTGSGAREEDLVDLSSSSSSSEEEESEEEKSSSEEKEESEEEEDGDDNAVDIEDLFDNDELSYGDSDAEEYEPDPEFADVVDEDDMDEYLTAWETYLGEKSNLIGKVLAVRQGSKTVEWEIIEEYEPENPIPDDPLNKSGGVVDFRFRDFHDMPHPVSELFTTRLYSIDHWPHIQRMNHMAKHPPLGTHLKPLEIVNEDIYFKFVGTLIVAGVFQCGREELFKEFMWSDNFYESLPSAINLSSVMSKNRHKNLWKLFFSSIKFDTYDQVEKAIENKEWGNSEEHVRLFNARRAKYVRPSRTIVGDESMSFYLPQTEKTGDLPHLSKNDRKPRAIGTELKNAGDGEHRIMLGEEIQKGKEAMSDAKYIGTDCGPSAACARRLSDFPKDCFKAQNVTVPRFRMILDAGFGNLMTAKILSAGDVEAIMNIKHGKGGMPRDKILALSKGWPAGAYLVLRCKTKLRIRGTNKTIRPIFVYYKSGGDKKKCNQFYLATEGAASTKPAPVPYTFRYRVPGTNRVELRDVERPQIVATYAQYSGVIDEHNQYRQGSLGIERAFRATSGHHRISCTLLGQDSVDTYLALQHHLPSSDPIHKMTVREFASVLANELVFLRTWSKDTSEAHELLEDEDEGAASVPGSIMVGGRTSASSALSYGSATTPSKLPKVPEGAPIVPEWFRKRHGIVETAKRSLCNRDGCKSGNSKNKSNSHCKNDCGCFCKDLQGVHQNKGVSPRWCYYDHICYAWKTSGEREYDSSFEIQYEEWCKTRVAKWVKNHS